MADMIVAGAGNTAVNGTYIETGTFNDKPRYTKNSTYGIVWTGATWAIYGDGDEGWREYESEPFVDFATPDLVTTWFTNASPAPVPTVTAASSGQNLTLSCAAGSHSLTGVACTLTYTPAAQNLTLSCGAGSLALTGSAATFEVKRNFVLSASAGSYAVTGTSASLTKNLVMACESGGAYPNIAVSGAGTSEVNGTYTYAGEGPYGKPYYTLGENMVFWYGAGGYWVLAGSYYSTDDVATPDLVTTWTVSDGYLPVPTVTSSPATSYALTGSSVTLTKSLVLSCETGSYTLTGSDVSFGNTKAYTLACGVGTYSQTGTALAFIVQRNFMIACNAGSYSLTGSAVTLTTIHNYSLSCTDGSYSLAGSALALTSARTLALGAGAYSLTGTSSGLFRGLVLPCAAGSYVLTGTNAGLNANYVFALNIGSYVMVGTAAGLFILTAAPDCRTYFIGAENRTLIIGSEDRTHIIDAENRTMEVRCH